MKPRQTDKLWCWVFHTYGRNAADMQNISSFMSLDDNMSENISARITHAAPSTVVR